MASAKKKKSKKSKAKKKSTKKKVAKKKITKKKAKKKAVKKKATKKKAKKKAVKKKVTKKKAVKKKTTAKKSAPKKAKASKKAPAIIKVQGRDKKVKNWDKFLKPLDDRVLVAADGKSEVTSGGIIIPGSASLKAPNQGRVLSVGRGAQNKKGSIKNMDVEVGDKVLYSDYAGTKVNLEDEELLILRESDILGIIA